MTHHHPWRQAHKKNEFSVGRMVFCLLSIFCFLLFLRNSEIAIAHIGRGLTLCVNTVIPSLFPFMVISELLVGSGAGEALGRLLAKPMQWFFGASGAGSCAVVLGSLCGFPVGASTAVSLLDHNLISKRECEHLLTFVNNPSSAFLTIAVGVSMYGNRRLGVLMYGVILGCGLLTGFVARFLMNGKRRGLRHNHPHYPMGFHPNGVVGQGNFTSQGGIAQVFTNAISRSAVNLLTVCAYVVFFSALTGVLATGVLGYIQRIGGTFGDIIYALLGGFLELSGGMSQTAKLAGNTAFGIHATEISLILSAMAGGWSGLSVHCQVMTLCGGRGISFKPYVRAKFIQGLLCGGVMWLVLRLVDPAWLTPTSNTMVGNLLDLTSHLSLPTIPTVLSHIGLIAGGILYIQTSRKIDK